MTSEQTFLNLVYFCYMGFESTKHEALEVSENNIVITQEEMEDIRRALTETTQRLDAIMNLSIHDNEAKARYQVARDMTDRLTQLLMVKQIELSFDRAELTEVAQTSFRVLQGHLQMLNRARDMGGYLDNEANEKSRSEAESISAEIEGLVQLMNRYSIPLPDIENES